MVLPTPSASPSIPYRPEIDGLRAIAVVAVILYHSEIVISQSQFLPGGFIGVDVFFVISGYLIASILIRGFRSSHFSLIHFYEKRARRILPVLFTVLSLCLLISWLVLDAQAMWEYAGSTLSLLFFGSNIWFFFEDPYLAEASRLKPLLHTWSVSIEEQFYLLFPLAFLGLWRLGKAWTPTILLSLFVVSLGLAQWGGGLSPEARFYLLPTRGWELLAGILLAWREERCGPVQSSSLSRWIPWVGIIVIITSFLFFEPQTPHPSLFTLIPVLGTVGIIAYAQGTSPVIAFLGNRFLVGLGLLSYSLYLWHVPVLAFARVGGTVLDGFGIGGQLACVVLLSLASFYLIERPLRSSSFVGQRSFWLGTGIVFLGLLGSHFWIYQARGAPFRMAGWDNFRDDLHPFRNFRINGKVCHNTGGTEFCQAWVKSASGKTLVNFGDSHASSLGEGLYRWSQEKGWNYLQYTRGACLVIPGFLTSNKSGVACGEKESQKLFEYLLKLPPAILLVTHRLPMYLTGRDFYNEEFDTEGAAVPYEAQLTFGVTPSEEEVRQTLEKSFELLRRHGHQLYLVDSFPEFGIHIRRLTQEKLKGISDSTPLKLRRAFERLQWRIPYREYLARNAKAVRILAPLVDRGLVKRLDSSRAFCDPARGFCRAKNSQHLFYWDDNHPSRFGAGRIVNHLVQQLEAEWAQQSFEEGGRTVSSK